MISAQCRNGYALVTVRCELDRYSVPVLRETMRQLLSDGQGLIVVDLRDVEFSGFCGVSVLLSTSLRAHRAGRRVALVAASPYVTRLLWINGLDAYVSVHDTVADALRRFGHVGG